MNIQDYKNEIQQDVLQYAEESKDYFDSLESFRDSCFLADSITGNGSGSYTFNAEQAKENIEDLLFSDELESMFSEFGYDSIPYSKGPEFIDVSIRCFLLDEVINKNEEEIKELLGLNEEEEN